MSSGSLKDERPQEERAQEFIDMLEKFSEVVSKADSMRYSTKANTIFEKEKEGLLKYLEDSGRDFPNLVLATVRNLSFGNYEMGVEKMAVPKLKEIAGEKMEHESEKKGLFSKVSGLLSKLGVKSGGATTRHSSKSDERGRGRD